MSEHISKCPSVQLAYLILKVPTKKKTIFTAVSGQVIECRSNIKLWFSLSFLHTAVYRLILALKIPFLFKI